MQYFFEILNYLKDGIIISLLVFFLTIIFSFPLSFLLMIAYRFNKILKKIIQLYTWLFRGTPLMLQLFFFMYGLPQIGINLDRFLVAILTFIINYAAYFIEILRSGIESLPKDQEESSKVMGATSFQTYRFIIFPQALRTQLPTITNEIITLIKDTALVSVIAVDDLMRSVKEIVSRDFTVLPFVIACVFYLFISFLIIKIMRGLEKKFDYLDSI